MNCSRSSTDLDRISGLLFFALLLFPTGLLAQWSTEQRLSTLDTSAGLNENMGQCLAVSGDSIHVVWTNTKAGDHGVYYKHSFDGGLTWTGETKLTGATSNADLPSIAASGNTVHIMWRDTIGAQNVNYYIRSLDGGKTWGPKVFFGNWYWWPSITCAGNMVFVALNSNTPGNTEVWFQRSTDNGTTWDSVKRISNALGRSEDPSISASDGHVYLVWNDNRDSTNTVPKQAQMKAYARVSSDNGVTWGPETLWNNPPSKSYFPFVHASGANVDFVWGDLRTTYQVFYKHSSDHGATWSAEQPLTSGNGGDYPVVTRNGFDVYAEWFLFGSNAGITYRHSSDGGTTWDTPVALVSGAGNPGSPFIFANGSTLHTIWLDQRDGYHAVYYKRTVPETTTTGRFTTPTYIVSFGQVKVNATRFDTITIHNAGDATLHMLNYSIAQSASTYKFAVPLPYVIPAGGSASIIVQFSPLQPIAYPATLVIETDEAASSFDSIVLLGTGVLVVSKIEVNPTTLNFGDVDSGASSMKQFSITNTGGILATINTLSITNSPMFSVSTTTVPLTLGIGETDTIVVLFKPTESGASTGFLTIGTTDGSQPQILLHGVGVGKKDTISGGALVRYSTSLVSLLEVSPNPASTNATLKLGATKQLEDVKLSFYDAAARLIRTQDVGSLGEGIQNIPLLLPTMSGVAFVRVTSAGEAIGTVAVAIIH